MVAPIPDSVSAVHNATNATRDMESDFEAGQDVKFREISIDNVDSNPKVIHIQKICACQLIYYTGLSTVSFCAGRLSYNSLAERKG